MSRQTLGLVGAASLIAGWMLASTASPPVAQTQGEPARRAGRSMPDVPSPQFEPLMAPDRALPPAPRAQRNPFTFEGRTPERQNETFGIPGDETFTVAPEDIPRPAAPAVRLVGVAAEITGDGLVRTAILSDGREMWLLRAGSALPDGRTVRRVDEHAVVLVDGDGHEHVLTLR